MKKRIAVTETEHYLTSSDDSLSSLELFNSTDSSELRTKLTEFFFGKAPKKDQGRGMKMKKRVAVTEKEPFLTNSDDLSSDEAFNSTDSVELIHLLTELWHRQKKRLGQGNEKKGRCFRGAFLEQF